MKNKPTIFAYGFDLAGFPIPSRSFESEEFVIRFVTFNEAQTLEEADGVIVPSGIFEREVSSYGGAAWLVCRDVDHLAKREKEIFQNFKRGGWIAFLLREIDNEKGKADIDLAKRFLNPFFYEVKCHDPNPHVCCKADEFADYLHDYGINRTTFWSPRDDYKPRILATTHNGRLVAAQILGQFFFLPLPSIKKEEADLITLVTKCTGAILEHKQRNDLHLPAWVESVEFQSENVLRAEVKKLEEEIIQRRQELSKWRRYKGVLSASGNALNGLIVEILRDFFRLNLHSKEEFIDDAIIYAEDKPLFVVEIKGVNGGLKRDHVNQVDSHRERLGIAPEVPGLLIINDFNDVVGLLERKSKAFDKLHVSHAEKLNIKILRTTTFLETIKQYELEADRGQKFINLCLRAKPMVEL